MAGSPQYDFKTTELDPELLSTPFGVQTKWHVLTGAACSGKTTLINQLANKGFQTVPEAGRIYIELELAKGRTFDDMFANAADQISMKSMQLKIEQGLRATEVTFLDRALPDCLTFHRFCGLDPNEILADTFQNHYASVFILDRLPFHQNGARIGHDATSNLLDEPKERLAFVLDNLSSQGLL
jgi:predicted ATPase